jgi:hypothetical protein
MKTGTRRASNGCSSSSPSGSSSYRRRRLARSGPASSAADRSPEQLVAVGLTAISSTGTGSGFGRLAPCCSAYRAPATRRPMSR